MKTIFTGTTEECIKHLGDRMRLQPKAADIYAARDVIAAFTGTVSASVYRWFAGRNPPVGEPLLKLRYFLELHGYGVKELLDLRTEVRDAGRVFAYGFVSVKDLGDFVGYKNSDNTVMLTILRGVNNPSEDKAAKLAEIANMYRVELETKRRETPKLELTSGSPAPSAKAADAKPLVHLPVRANGTGKHEPVGKAITIQALAGMVMALIPLAKYLESDACTAEDRKRLRDLTSINGVSGDGIFKLSNMLSRLNGERSRTLHQQEDTATHMGESQ